MAQRTTSVMILGVILAAAGIAVVVHGQATTRPGEPTQAHVRIDNRSAAEAIPVVVESTTAPLVVRIDSSSILQTTAGRQAWEYRTIPLASGAEPARALAQLGAEGWEAVGVVLSNQAGATILLKRPR